MCFLCFFIMMILVTKISSLMSTLSRVVWQVPMLIQPKKDRANYIKEVYCYKGFGTLKYSHGYFFYNVWRFLMDNKQPDFSNKVSQLLTANETPTNHVTIGKYIKYLCNAFVFYDIYDIPVARNILKALQFYLCDSGIRYAILGSRKWIMAEYMKTSLALSFFAVDMMFMSASSIKEIDFVAQRRREVLYSGQRQHFPVRNILRECSSLLQIRDAYRK